MCILSHLFRRISPEPVPTVKLQTSNQCQIVALNKLMKNVYEVYRDKLDISGAVGQNINLLGKIRKISEIHPRHPKVSQMLYYLVKLIESYNLALV